MTIESLTSNGTVMIVDDTPGNLALLSDTLSEADYRVLVATDGLSAIEQMHYLKPDIILLDVMMPGIDGFETCHRLKSNPETADIPVLFMTGLSELDDLLRGFGEGAQDYIVKPIRPPEVLARIEVHLNQSRTFRRVQNALHYSAFSALSIDAAMRIIWFTSAAKEWLDEFALQHHQLAPVGIGDRLPAPLSQWAQQALSLKAESEPNQDSYADYSVKDGFSARMDLSPHVGEYLLVLQKNTAAWDLDALRSTLGLTFREAEILMWISRGKTNKEIGMILDSSPRTVNKHLEHIFEKLGVGTRAAAVTMVLQKCGTNR